MKQKINLLAKVIISIISGGLFYIYWLYSISRRANILTTSRDLIEARKHAKWDFILILFVPFYGAIWYYNTEKRFVQILNQKQIVKPDHSLLYLIVMLAFVPFLGLFAFLDATIALFVLYAVSVVSGLITACFIDYDMHHHYLSILPVLEFGIFLREDRPAHFVRRLTVRKVVVGLLSYAWLIMMCVIVLTPVIWMVSASFTRGTQLAEVPIIPNISEWTFANYIDLFTKTSSSEAGAIPDYVKAFLTTLIIASSSMILVVIMSSLVGFSFSRYRFKGKKQVLLTMLGLQMFPSFMGMLALFMFFRQFELLNKPLALTLIYVAGSIPYNTFVVRGFMRNIPKSLDEAAFIDGASNLQTLIHIIIPLAVPIMGFIAVNAFMGPWLDYILPSVIMPQRDTVAVWLFRYMDPLSATYSPIKFMTGALFLAVPIMIVQVFMQRYLVYGLTSGAEKG